ncbi:FGGY family carbohydrate kinase [Roseospira navarrensis]|uniref:ATP:glycerol 3-phosphotransferase n=1 Tax=Roseospira navarrensis TaxID=140058 RepID=A0A7X2D2G6_9PROT|nr:FGGY family carbohydrate kinase [Roseospira navarrensis]MQX35753.1 glycerol kinase [Roseospira navarrensis]
MSDPAAAVLAIDQGTTSTRGLRLAADGSATVRHAVTHAQHYPKPDWVEHDPADLLRSIDACLEAAGPVRAVALDNQGESCLAWDAETLEPLSPVVVWQDSRTQSVVDALKRDGAEAEVMRRSGLPLDSYFSASKLAWLYQTVPDAARLHARGRLRLGTTDAFFLHRLTGRCVTDATTASRTSLMNIETLAWDPDLCRLFGVPLEALPPIVPTTGDFGTLMTEHGPVPVVTSIVDQQAALYGHGCRVAGDAKITFGTGAFALMVTGDSPLRAPERGLSPTVAWHRDGEAPQYAIDGAVFCASAAVNWARDLGLFRSFDEINAFEGPSAVERGLVFVPALTGLACPHWVRKARGAWLGLSLETTAADMVRAVLEGVAFRAAEVLEAMGSLRPTGDTVSVDGGLTANPYFVQFLACALDRRIVVPAGAEVTALGAARLAAEHVGLTIPARDTPVMVEPPAIPGSGGVRFQKAVSIVADWP